MRRVVTGHGPAGRSVVVSDGEPPRRSGLIGAPGFTSTLVWSTDLDRPATVVDDDPTPTVQSFVPSAGGTRLIALTIPPDEVFTSPSFDHAAAAAERLITSPGLAETFEPDHPGMHTTPTVDYGVVMQGSPTLELDDGEQVLLHPGDIVVQNGTRHAWRNHTDRLATLLFVLVGSAPGPEPVPTRSVLERSQRTR